MLRDLGCDWIRVHDRETRRGVKTVQMDDEYRMRFEPLETRTVRIGVRVRRIDGMGWLHLYPIDGRPLGTASSHLFRELKTPVGAVKSVTDKRPGQILVLPRHAQPGQPDASGMTETVASC